MTEGNFRTSVDAALNEATAVLEHLSGKDVRELPVAEQVSYALAEAAVAIGHSLRHLVHLADEAADERRRRG